MTNITILGSTGSIGQNTLRVIRENAGNSQIQVFALSANQNADLLAEQCRHYQPRFVVINDTQASQRLAQLLQQFSSPTQVLIGQQGLLEIASHPETDVVMSAIVGAAGLAPTLAAAKAGKRILLANKEALVMAGHLLIATVRKYNALLIPVDSEHNAIFQCLGANYQAGTAPEDIEKIILTASGGPFLNTPFKELSTVTPEQACAHPRWRMGKKISVDSATMMNKCLEVIEAHWLFAMSPQQIEVIIHPQSVIHSLVVFKDSSILAQLGEPDMRIPIANALAWPKRISSGAKKLDLLTTGRFDFREIDHARYPAIRLAYEVLDAGNIATIALNAANEVAVQAFLKQEIQFTDIIAIIRTVLDKITGYGYHRQPETLAEILDIDQTARQLVNHESCYI